MARNGANIYKRKDGRWEGRYIKGYDESGKAKYGYLYSKTYTEVKKKMAEAQAGNCRTETNSNIKFSDLAGKWLVVKKLKVKASTYAGYVNMLRKHILPELGGYKLYKLSSGVFDKFAGEKLKSGRLNGTGGLSVKYVRDILSVLKSIIAYGEAERLIVRDSIVISYPKNTEKEMRVLSKEEQIRLESTLAQESDICKFGVILCLYTGLRIGEICALKWKDISLKKEIISVRKTIQ